MPKGFDIKWMTPTGDPQLIVTVLMTIAAIVVALVIGAHYYRRWRKHRRFTDELNQFALEEDEGSTLVGLVKRYATDEPVEILYSLRAFDELAEKEMKRILGVQGSQEAKQRYIELLYTIRQKTYFADLIEEANGTASSNFAG